MLRWASIAILLSACARSGPPPARLFADGTGNCPETDGCEVPIEAEPRYAPPDEAHPPPDTEPEPGPRQGRGASCTDVGISVASIELGNYADDEQRAPIARKYRARCMRARLAAAERQCVFEAGDAATVAWCAPRFWPEVVVELVEPSTCAALTKPIRDQTQGDDPQLTAVQRSCEQDRWTVAFGQCASALPLASYVVAYCQYVAPAPLLARLQERLTPTP